MDEFNNSSPNNCEMLCLNKMIGFHSDNTLKYSTAKLRHCVESTDSFMGLVSPLDLNS